MSHYTPVHFKKFPDGEVIALFPKEPWDNTGKITSYMRNGQHAGADRPLLWQLEDATQKEYQPLLRELRTLVGYKRLMTVNL